MLAHRPLIHPKQPDVILSADHFQKHILTHDRISHFYSFTAPEGDSPFFTALPDGCIDILFCCDLKNPGAVVAGTVRSPKRISLVSGAPYFGVRFMPSAQILMAKASMRELCNTIVPYEGVFKDRALLESIVTAANFQSRADLLLSVWRRDQEVLRDSAGGTRSLYSFMAREINARHGDVRLLTLSEESGYSTRYLTRVFKETLGLSPKEFSQIVRFQYLLNFLALSADDLGRAPAGLAVQTGYYDQAHLIRDFHKFAGTTPGHYLQYLRQKGYPLTGSEEYIII